MAGVSPAKKPSLSFGPKLRATQTLLLPAARVPTVEMPKNCMLSDWKSFVHETGWRNKKEQQQEKQFLLSGKGRGSVICRFKSHGLYPASSHVDRAYLEESNNGRLKVRIFNTTDTLDNSFTVHGKKEEQVTWTSPDDWFVCK